MPVPVADIEDRGAARGPGARDEAVGPGAEEGRDHEGFVVLGGSRHGGLRDARAARPSGPFAGTIPVSGPIVILCRPIVIVASSLLGGAMAKRHPRPHDRGHRPAAAAPRLLRHGAERHPEASGAPRGSLYFHFPGGKDQLVLEATRRAVEETTAYLRATLAEARGPAEGVRAFFDAAADLLVETEYTFGCPVAPVILDAPDALPELQELCRQAFEEWVGLFRDAFADGRNPARPGRGAGRSWSRRPWKGCCSSPGRTVKQGRSGRSRRSSRRSSRQRAGAGRAGTDADVAGAGGADMLHTGNRRRRG